MTKAAIQITSLYSQGSCSQPLQNIHLTAYSGQVSVLYSPDKTASRVLKAISGTLRPCSGSVRIHGTEAVSLDAHAIRPLGLISNPDPFGSDQILESLSTEENLLSPSTNQHSLGGGLSLAEIYEICPLLYALRKLSVAQLSPCERSILGLVRLLRTGADIVLLDHVSAGLQPLVQQALGRLIRELKKRSYTVLMAEESAIFSKNLADQHVNLAAGQLISSQHTAAPLNDITPSQTNLLGGLHLTRGHNTHYDSN